MKLNNELAFMEFGDSYIAVPVGKTDNDFRGVIQLNETAKDICKGLFEGLNREQIAKKLVTEYSGVDEQSALAAVDNIVAELKKRGLVE